MCTDWSCVGFQGETPLDLAKQRKNVWMINHLQEARQAKGYDSPSYLKRLKMDKVHTDMLKYFTLCMKKMFKPLQVLCFNLICCCLSTCLLGYC